MIKLLTFDFDGVIEDDYEKHYELTKKEIIGLTREEHHQLFDGNIHEQLKKFEHRMTDFDLKKHFSEYKNSLTTKKEIKDALKNLSKSYTLGIVSSAMEKGTKEYLKNNGLDKDFLFVYGKETHNSKVEKFGMILKNFDLGKSEMIFITDTLGDILEANEAGIKTIAVDFGFHERKRLEKGKPLIILSSFNEISNYLENLK